MKSTYTTNHPLMKMAPLDMMSSRPRHETRKAEPVVATTITVLRNRDKVKR